MRDLIDALAERLTSERGQLTISGVGWTKQEELRYQLIGEVVPLLEKLRDTHLRQCQKSRCHVVPSTVL